MATTYTSSTVAEEAHPQPSESSDVSFCLRPCAEINASGLLVDSLATAPRVPQTILLSPTPVDNVPSSSSEGRVCGVSTNGGSACIVDPPINSACAPRTGEVPCVAEAVLDPTILPYDITTISSAVATTSSSTATASSGSATPSASTLAASGLPLAATATISVEDKKAHPPGMNPPPPIVLSPAVHALNCDCGELLLRSDEVQLMQSYLLPFCFRLVECPPQLHGVRPRGGKSSRNRTTAGPSRRVAQELEALHAACDSSAFEPGKRRQKKVNSRYEDTTPRSTTHTSDDRGRARARSGSPGSTDLSAAGCVSTASVKSDDVSVISQSRSRLKAGRSRGDRYHGSTGSGIGTGNVNDSCSSMELGRASQGAHASELLSSPIDQSRGSRKRRHVIGDDIQSLDGDMWGEMGEAVSASGGRPRQILASARWRDSCMRILQHIKTQKASQWFLYPVEPELDGVPDYFDIVHHPMDLQTIEHKLVQGQYHHPFMWQQDVRQVFFNAFSYHTMSNDVWRDATSLALEFERCCKQIDEVNPYAEVISDSDELAATLQNVRNGDNNDIMQHADAEQWRSVSANDGTNRPRRTPASQEALLSHHNQQSQHGRADEGGTTSYIANASSASYARGRARRNQRQAEYVDEDGCDDYSSLGRSSKKPYVLSPRSRGIRGRGRGARTSVPVSLGRSATWDNGGTMGAAGCTNAVLEAFQHAPAPPNAPVLPPPLVPRIGVNDRPLSGAQRRTLGQHMQLLSPEQRRAALELIQDDLGILASDHMCDKNFCFDTELLSIEKQKRMFAYVNSMIRANRELFVQRQGGNATGAGGESPVAAVPEDIENTDNGDRVGGSSLKKRSKGIENGGNSRVDSDSSSSGSGSSTSSSSDSLSSSSSSSDSDSDSSNGGDSGAARGPLGSGPAASSSSSALNSCDTVEAPEATSKVSAHALPVQKALPEYRPVTENGEKMQIREELMGRHADFLGVIDSQGEETMMGAPREGKATAWQEWKGQVIQQGFAAERAVAPQRSAREIIAEGYDARI